MNVPQPSIAARILDVIARAPAPIHTTEIYAQVEEAESITLVSVTCRDLLLAEKVQRQQIAGRWHYAPRQLDLLAEPPVPAAAEELPHIASTPRAPAKRTRAQTLCGRRAEPGTDRGLKLRTLDKLIVLFADDIASVLRAIRKDVESLA